MKECLEVIKVAMEVTWRQVPWLKYVMYLAVASIILFEKDKTRKLVFGVFSLLLLVMLFNPLTVIGMKPFFGTRWVYYVRFFLIIPIPVIIAYGLTLLFAKLKEMPRLIVIIAFIAVIVLKGDYIYDDVNFKKAENFSKIPRDIEELSELLSEVQGYKSVLISSKISIYIRQIDASIILSFGRADDGNKISEQIDSEYPDVGYVIDYVVKNNCDYFMANRSDSSINRYLEKDCTVIGYTDNYALLKYNDSPARTYDKYGNLESLTYTDSSGKPEMLSEGYATVRYSYDIDGRKTGEYYEDENNKPVMLDSGYAGVGYKYDRLGRLIETAYFNDSMELIIVNDYGYAIMQREYNDDNYEIKRTYLDSEGKPILITSGYATIRWKYNESGNAISTRYYDEKGNPAQLKSGEYGYDSVYDELGREIERIYVNGEGLKSPITTGYDTVQYERDISGNITKEMYFLNNEPFSVSKGFFGIRYEHDSKGRVIKTTYVDSEGEPMMIEGGYSCIVFERDSDGVAKFTTYFDLEGNVVVARAVE